MNYCPFPLWWSDNPPLHVWIVLNWIVSCADGWLLSRESLIGPCHQILRLASMIFTEGVHTFEVLWNKLLMFSEDLYNLDVSSQPWSCLPHVIWYSELILKLYLLIFLRQCVQHRLWYYFLISLYLLSNFSTYSCLIF